jgi:hypothetical protein
MLLLLVSFLLLFAVSYGGTKETASGHPQLGPVEKAPTGFEPVSSRR